MTESMARPAGDSGPDVTLLVAGLPSPESATRALRQLLARADQDGFAPAGFESRLFALFGLPTQPGRDLPVAAVTRLADMGIVDHDWWIRADPVYLEPRRDSLVLRGGLRLRREDAERLTAELNAVLSGEGWVIRAPCAGRWYLRPSTEPALRTTPLAAARGRDVRSLLPEGPDRGAWHARLNEIQILMHGAAVNAEREANGLLPANSVWFWGGGRLPGLGAVGWSQLWGQDPLSIGLGRLAGIPVATGLPAEGYWESLACGRQLIVIAPEEGPAGVETDPTTLRWLWTQWLAPLQQAVHTGQIRRLTVMSDRGPAYHYRRGCRWRFWRRAPAGAATGREAAA